jgi:hypothetical protein
MFVEKQIDRKSISQHNSVPTGVQSSCLNSIKKRVITTNKERKREKIKQKSIKIMQ